MEQYHKKLAVDNFNKTWNYIEKPDRTNEDNIDMIHCAHASRYHWGEIGTEINLQRGEWLVSRVYAILNMGESSLLHANECLNITEKNNITDFDLAFAYESMARAYKVLDDEQNSKLYIEKALAACESIKNEDDKDYTLSEINTI